MLQQQPVLGQGHQSSGNQVFHHEHGLGWQQLIATGHSCEVKSCNSMTVSGGRTQSNHPQTGKRLAHPQPARQPLMLVNNQRFGHLGQGYGKDWAHWGSVSHHNRKNEHFKTTTLKFWLAKCFVTSRTYAAILHGPKASCPSKTRHGDRLQEPATPTRDTCLRPKSQSTTVYHNETKPRWGH